MYWLAMNSPHPSTKTALDIMGSAAKALHDTLELTKWYVHQNLTYI